MLLAVLLLVPLVSSGHHHAVDAPATGTCALCIVTHHAPVVVAAPPLAPAPAALHLATIAEPPAPAVHRARSPIAGRAPPSSSPGIAS